MLTKKASFLKSCCHSVQVMMEFCSDVLRETLAMCDDPSRLVGNNAVHPKIGSCIKLFSVAL